jgi:hypothetical protein
MQRVSELKWEPIRVGHPEIETNGEPAMVRVRLDPAPPEGWRILFGLAGFPVDLERPQFADGRSLTFMVRAADEERHIDAVVDAVAATNRRYEQEQLPRIQAELNAEEQAEANSARMQSDLSKRLDGQ